jgi:diguanylate cyclase (GGDEF)-like protein/PAS domain S-box-containing protein
MAQRAGPTNRDPLSARAAMLWHGREIARTLRPSESRSFRWARNQPAAVGDTRADPPPPSFQEVQQRFESSFANAPIGMALIGVDGRWLQVNAALCAMTGFDEEALLRGSLAALTHPEDVDTDVHDRARLQAGEIASYQVEKRYIDARGRLGWALFTTSIVRDRDRTALHSIVQVQDITDRKELEAQLVHLTDHDFLTGAFNRRRFARELDREIERSRRYALGGAIVVIDLDNFKDVNDTFGHDAGDAMLQGVAAALRGRTRHTDVLARLGGDEFAVLLPEAGVDEAATVARDLVRALSAHRAVLGERTIQVTASAGVAAFDGLSDVQVLAHADHAMYQAKTAGRNRVVVHAFDQPGGKQRIAERVDEVERLRDALRHDRFELHCQPIVRLADRHVSHYELLLRLRDADQLVPPGGFLHVAERFGLIQAIDEWVISQAVGLIAAHAEAGTRLTLAVNLSGKSIGDPDFAAIVERAITERAIDPAQLVLELTETWLIANIDEAKRFAARMRRLGCRFALDDFGSGFSAFFYLKNLPFDYLKIDGEFIRGLEGSPTDRLIVEAIARIARGMGIQTIAEFVSDDATLQVLTGAGIHYGQGYHVGRPAPVAEVLALA